MSEPRVTICVPVFNGRDFIGETLDALARQIYPRLIIHVSDDGSTDGSAAVCASAAADPRIRVTRQPARLGWVAHCTWLLDQVTTEFACLVSHDDLPAPDYVSRLVEALDAHPRAALAFSDIRVFGLLDKVECQPSVDEGTAAGRARAFMATHYDGTAFHGLLRREAIALAGGLAPNPCDDFAADVAWLGRVTRAGGLCRVAEPLYAKRRHARSVSLQWGRWAPETLVESWLVHCRELLHDALTPGLPAAESGRLVQAAVRRLLAIEPNVPVAVIRRFPTDRRLRMVARLLEGLPFRADGPLAGGVARPVPASYGGDAHGRDGMG